MSEQHDIHINVSLHLYQNAFYQFSTKGYGYDKHCDHVLNSSKTYGITINLRYYCTFSDLTIKAN